MTSKFVFAVGSQLAPVQAVSDNGRVQSAIQGFQVLMAGGQAGTAEINTLCENCSEHLKGLQGGPTFG
jgi:hypothetical protein